MLLSTAAILYLEWMPFTLGEPAAELGNWFLQALLLFILLVSGALGLLALPVGISIALGSASPPWRWIATHVAVACLSVTMVWWLRFPIGAIRRNALADLAERSKPVLEAITRYERECGSPLLSLEALVPAYLAEVPGTSLRGYPHYRYEVFAPEHTLRSRTPWERGVFVGFDKFAYWPTRNYPQSKKLRRIGAWALFDF